MGSLHHREDAPDDRISNQKIALYLWRYVCSASLTSQRLTGVDIY